MIFNSICFLLRGTFHQIIVSSKLLSNLLSCSRWLNYINFIYIFLQKLGLHFLVFRKYCSTFRTPILCSWSAHTKLQAWRIYFSISWQILCGAWNWASLICKMRVGCLNIWITSKWISVASWSGWHTKLSKPLCAAIFYLFNFKFFF